MRAADVTVVSRFDLMQNQYRFECVSCAALITRGADAGIAALLLRAGAVMEPWPQALPRDDRADPTRPPFTNEDLIAFQQQLERLPTTDA